MERTVKQYIRHYLDGDITYDELWDKAAHNGHDPQTAALLRARIYEYDAGAWNDEQLIAILERLTR